MPSNKQLIKLKDGTELLALCRHVEFAKNVAHGMADKDSYLAVFNTNNEKTAESSASSLRKREDVQQLIEHFRAPVIKKLNIKRERILAEYASIAFSNVAEMFDSDGKMLALNAMPEHVQRSIKKVKIRRTSSADVEQQTGLAEDLIEIELHDKQRALDKIAEINKVIDPKKAGGNVNVTINTGGGAND
ncbi:MAG: terminase small subunit [Pseudomonadota bacterium]|nr:terminase small subunit [Pseudomonadota bacterium]